MDNAQVKGKELAAALLELGDDAAGTVLGAFKSAAMSGAITSETLQNVFGMSQYNGLRDIFTVAGWKPQNAAMSALAAAMPWYYSRHGTARELISKPPRLTWRGGFKVISANQSFADGANQLIDKLKLLKEFRKVDRLGRIGQYGALFFIYSDAAENPQLLRTPVAPGSIILGARGYAQAQATVAGVGRDGIPVFSVNMGDGVNQTVNKSVQVHGSRIVSVVEQDDGDEQYGTPFLVPLLPELDDLLKVAGASGEGYFRNARGWKILQAQQDKEGNLFTLGEEQETELFQVFLEMMQTLSEVILLKGVEVKELSNDPTDPSKFQSTIYERLAAGTGWPISVIVGFLTGKLAGDEDGRLFATTMDARRDEHAEPNIIDPTIERLIMTGQLQPETEWDYLWGPIIQPTASEIADNAAKTAKALSDYANASAVAGSAAIDENEFRETLGFEPRGGGDV